MLKIWVSLPVIKSHYLEIILCCAIMVTKKTPSLNIVKMISKQKLLHLQIWTLTKFGCCPVFEPDWANLCLLDEHLTFECEILWCSWEFMDFSCKRNTNRSVHRRNLFCYFHELKRLTLLRGLKSGVEALGFPLMSLSIVALWPWSEFSGASTSGKIGIFPEYAALVSEK